jgi:pyruvate,orthophosphate dikinase
VRHVFRFRPGAADASTSDQAWVGEKGAFLADLCRLEFPVPAGFTLSSELCRAFFESGRRRPPTLPAALEEGLGWLSDHTGRAFGDPQRPLLVSVRSGGAVSMPGMLDTVLNVGLTPPVAERWMEQHPRFALDTRFRHLSAFARVVGLDDESEVRKRVESEAELRAAVAELESRCSAGERVDWMHDPQEQLLRAVLAVFSSWDHPRAVAYRRQRDLPDDVYPSVTVQTMVFGNRDADSGTGVAFTRDPNTGRPGVFGEFLTQGQGDDVVGGQRTPAPLDGSPDSLRSRLPSVHRGLLELTERLEGHYRDLLDIEFTVESGHLWLLQVRHGPRTPAAAVRVAVDMATEGMITRSEALLRVTGAELEEVVTPARLADEGDRQLATGLPASPGFATGKLAFSPAEAIRRAVSEKVLLVRDETSPDDVPAMKVVQGVLTSRGGLTSHAAVVARGLGRPCVVGCRALHVDQAQSRLRIGDREFGVDDTLTLDGSTGEVLLGEVQTTQKATSEAQAELLEWADAERRLSIRSVADSVEDAEAGLEAGADGIGLYRTEDRWEDATRLALQAFVLAEGEAGRQLALSRLEQAARAEFTRLFEAVRGRPVTIRLLDPPSDDLLPRHDAGIRQVAATLGRSEAVIRAKISGLEDVNPALGLRGSRFGVVMAGLYECQARAVFQAAIDVQRRGIDVRPGLLFPLVSGVEELAWLRERTVAVASRVFDQAQAKVEHQIGTLIEVPRAALLSDALAPLSDFLCFGALDLTQTVFGLSREDARHVVPHYRELGLMDRNPFESFDVAGVGSLIRIAVERARRVRPDIGTGLLGVPHAEPLALRFAHELGIDYVACEVRHLARARLGAAQVAIEGTA